MAGRYCYKDVVPFTAMITMECTNVGLNTLFKAATNRGMSYYVFVVYSYGLAALVLLPSPFIFNSRTGLPPLSFSILRKMFLLGVIGATSQILGYKGISYSSPTLASAISNLIPAFTFILAIIFRMETVKLRSRSSRAKIIGTIVSISGAFVVTLFKGPPIILNSAPAYPSLGAQESNWVIGGLLLTAEYILVPLWYIVQAQIIKEYPSELVSVFFYNLFTALVAGVISLLAEPNLDAWKYLPIVALIAILYSGIVGSFLSNAAHTWVIRLKGPVYVAMFKPVAIVIAVAMGVMFLGDTLHLGSVIGAAIISVGFYAVMWGKSKEEIGENCEGRSEGASSQKTPLLQSTNTVDV
ncbi:EamA domain [Dillenia turbinata]|uniref:WAT1-related protein n=1 Tax=Dillenia turbinata TaxID=194707 RepID=A0AAN8UFQ6_9MAGN